MGEIRKGERPSREAWVVQGLVNLTCGGMLLLIGHWLASGTWQRAFWALAYDRGALLSFAAALSVVALGFDTAAAVRAGRPKCAWVAWAVLLMMGFGLGKGLERAIKLEMWSCCGNHGRGLRHFVGLWLRNNQQATLPAGEEMWKLAGLVGLETRENPGFDWTCPFARDGQAGWRYVAAGLRGADVVRHKLLLAIESHQHHPPGELCAHAVTGEAVDHCFTNAALAAEIRRCLDLHRRGLAPYSPSAVRILETELAARQRLAAARP